MTAVAIAGRGLACALGLDLASAVAALRTGAGVPQKRLLRGGLGGEFPYCAIPLREPHWNRRAREIVMRVAEEAGARNAVDGVLFVATSSYDIGAAENTAEDAALGDYPSFADRLRGWLGWRGPVYLINTGCTSGLNALLAAHALLSGHEAEEALVLGVELENRLTLTGFAAMQLLSRSACKPFGAHRDGLVLGEAVAALRLSARAGSRWQLMGGASLVDGSQPTGQSGPAIVDMYQRALSASGFAASGVDLIKVQAAGGITSDRTEAEALRESFARVPALVSLKAALGHAMGASGVAEVALLSACLECGAWPTYSDAVDTGLGVELAVAPPAGVRRLLATILGFGGSHATVAIECR